jgi:transcriptional regulator with GAF, ATPase, and Fis domain
MINQIKSDLQTSLKFLEIANRHTKMSSLLDAFVSEIQKTTDCEAIGIRVLDDNGRIPYQSYVGFSKQFYEQENSLSIDCDECMCTKVIKGMTDLKLPFYTTRGSFHTHSLTRFLLEVDKTKIGPTRNVCNHFGFESVALIPMCMNDRILGLIHLADTRENQLAEHAVEQLEWTAQQLAMAVHRITTEISLKESQESINQIGNNLPDGVIYRLVHKSDGRRYFNYISQGCKKLFQVTPKEVKTDANVLYKMFPPDDLERVSRLEREAIKNLAPFNLESPFSLPNGEIRWFQWHSQPKKLLDGSLIWDGVALDVSRRKYAEEALLKSRDELEVQVQKRTRDLNITIKNLKIEIENRKRVEFELLDTYSEISQLKSQLEADCTYLGEEIKLMHDHSNIVGESEVLKYVFYSMAQIAPTDSTVLILGESGTGKELIARAIHHDSNRNDRPLIKVDCASLPANLIESELFGHEKGAFTNAIEKRIGRFELANGATIFLDEIGELPLELQQKLLRILQEGEYERLGSSHVRHTDVRIIAATNRNIEEDVNQGRFRADLWYRLNVFPLSIPPLRERMDDIPLLVNWIINRLKNKFKRDVISVPIKVMDELMAYSWPGNVRELENVIERAVIVSSGKTLRLNAPLKISAPVDPTPDTLPLQSLLEVEKNHILRALKITRWNISGKGGAADLLGLNASTLRGRMRKYKIFRPSV